MTVFDFLAQSALPRPDVTIDDARQVALDRWGVAGDITELGSNQDRNFLIDTRTATDHTGGRRMLLKFSNPAFGDDELVAQNLAADAVAGSGLRAPRSVPSLAGADIETVGGLRVRLLSFVEGSPLTSVSFEPAALGALSARVALALGSIAHPGALQRTQWNLQLGGEVVALLLPQVANAARRGRVSSVADSAVARLAAVRDGLRTQVIHGDVTDDNAVASGSGAADSTVDGVIDFGDVAESWTVAELAVTCIATLHRFPREPLRVLDTVAAFHELLPLTAPELDALWPLVQLRAAVLVVSGEHQVALESDNTYAAENRAHEWQAFEIAAGLDADDMRTLIGWRLGAGSMSPIATPVATPVATPQALLLDASSATRLDLSVVSPALDAGAWLEPDVETRLAGEAASGEAVAGGAAWGVTAWGVPRLSRARPLSAVGVATVPLGIEVTVDAPTPVLAPHAGTVRHAGGAVVLEGDSDEVWVTGLDGIAAEGAIEAGAVLGTLAPHPESAWVQVSRTHGSRPPTFVAPRDAAVWKQVCPDPSALLGLTPTREAITADELLAERDAAFATVQEHYYAEPPRIERGWREHLIDTDGQTYLDMVNNVATTGHSHPRLVEAVARQWALLNTNSRFHYAAVAEFSARLAQLAPDGLDTVFLVNSGSEAVDLALRLAQIATGRSGIIAMKEAYHGWTVGSDAVTSSLGDNPRALETRPGWVRLIEPPHRVTVEQSLASLDTALGPQTAGVIAEAVFGNGGGVLLPDGYLSSVYARVRAAGGLCIADEVQVGYGRLGSHFWGFEQQGVVPDIITIAKAMGNGHPLGAVITTRAIADAFAAEGSMFSSAGGSPVSCVVGLTVLDIMRDEELVENARVIGEHLRSRLLELGYPVHGMGLYLGVELPTGALATAVSDALLQRGVIMQPTGDHKNVLKIKPPMVITRESVDYFVDQLALVLAAV